MLTRCVFVIFVFVTVSGLPPLHNPTWFRPSSSLTNGELQYSSLPNFRRPTWPHASNSLTNEELQYSNLPPFRKSTWSRPFTSVTNEKTQYSSLPPLRRPTWPRSSTSLTREELQDPLPWIKFSHFGNILTQFPKVVSDIAEAGPKIETDNKKFQVIINVKDYSKENLQTQIKGDFIIIKGTNVQRSLISEFSQTYSLPLKVNPSSVTAVLTSDGYLVLNAPLGSATKKNNIDKIVSIVESKEPLQTQDIFIKQNNVPVLPIFKLVKDENTKLVTEVPQSYEEGSKNVLLENNIVSPISIVQEDMKQEPALSLFTESNKNTLTFDEPSKSEEKVDNSSEYEAELMLTTTQETQVNDESNNNVASINTEVKENLTNEITLNSQQLTSPVTDDSGTIVTIMESTTSNIFENIVSTTIVPVLKSNLDSQNDDNKESSLKLSQDPNNLEIFSTFVPQLETSNDDKKGLKVGKISEKDQKDDEQAVKPAISTMDFTTLSSSEVFTNKPIDSPSFVNEELIEKTVNIVLTTMLPTIQASTSAAALPDSLTLTSQESLPDKIVESNIEETKTFNEVSVKEKEEINLDSFNILSTTPLSTLGNSNVEALEPARETIPEQPMQEQDNIKPLEDTQQNVDGNSTMMSNGEALNDNIELEKTVITPEEPTSVPVQQLIEVNTETHPTISPDQVNVAVEELPKDTVGISNIDSLTGQPLPITSIQSDENIAVAIV